MDYGFDIRCPSGLVIGEDFNEYDQCKECNGEPYYYCKDKRSSCVGKVPFVDKKQAIAEVGIISRNHGVKYGIYHCRFCSYWHLTKQ